MIPKASELKVSNEIVNNAAALRSRMDADSYLFFRGLLDPDSVRDLRLQILNVLRAAGWLKAGSKLEDAVADVAHACAHPEPDYMQVYNKVYGLEAFHRMPHSQTIVQIMGKLIDEEVLVHPFKIGRIMFPTAANLEYASSLAHQDWSPIQGAFDTYACWTPIGDCPPEMGGLLLLTGSNKNGLLEHKLANGPGGRGADIAELEGEWVTTHFHTGDILIFHSLNVHMAQPNLTDKIRLSSDVRYCGVSQQVSSVSMQPHGTLSWEEIYAGWESTDLQFHWEKHDLDIVPFDTSFNEKRDAEALAEGRKGNKIAKAALLNIAYSSSDPAKRSAAKEVLQQLEAN